MSIRIDVDKCIGCFKCIKVCPGSLIYSNKSRQAYIKYEKDCWGCTACVKECEFGAIHYYLGADIGGNGAYLYTSQNSDELKWNIVDKNGTIVVVNTNRKESNKY
jgi:adenylylsulfate reductase subunit B